MAGTIEVIVNISVHTGLAWSDIVASGSVTLHSADVGCWSNNVVDDWTLLDCWAWIGTNCCLVFIIDWANIKFESAFSISTVRPLRAENLGAFIYAVSPDTSFITLAIRIRSAVRRASTHAFTINAIGSNGAKYFAAEWDTLTILANVPVGTFHVNAPVNTFVLGAGFSIFAIGILETGWINWVANSILTSASLDAGDCCAEVHCYAGSSLAGRPIGADHIQAPIHTVSVHTFFVWSTLVIKFAFACRVALTVPTDVTWSTVDESALVLALAIHTDLARWTLAIRITVS